MNDARLTELLKSFKPHACLDQGPGQHRGTTRALNMRAAPLQYRLTSPIGRKEPTWTESLPTQDT